MSTYYLLGCEQCKKEVYFVSTYMRLMGGTTEEEVREFLTEHAYTHIDQLRMYSEHDRRHEDYETLNDHEPGQVVELKDPVEREAQAVACVCGGFAKSVDVTPAENLKYGCGQSWNCCSVAFKCGLCNRRLVGRKEAPESF